MGDTFSSLALSLGAKGVIASRQASILLLAATALLPLCSLQSLAALAPCSVLGVAGVGVTGGFLGLRLLQGAYSTGRFATAIAPALRPCFGINGMRPLFPSALVLISMVATAYQAHFSAPAIFNELKDKSVAKFNIITAISFAIIMLVTLVMMAFGFLTFGGASTGLILNNYATADGGATLSRFLMGFAILGSYPICFNTAREAIFELCPSLSKARELLSRSLLAALTAAAITISDVSFVVSFVGATLGSCIIYIFPALLFLATSKAQQPDFQFATKLERLACRSMLAIGIILAVLGGVVSILSSFTSLLG
mmetsp:Transcript_23298/g.38520  ORF Transcript_23298/g.38520 Transcript_23298/m.38520 type:complete len:311 (+) Transcript_23298:1-933(+)